MNDFKVFPIGKIKNEENEVKIVIDLEYRDYLKDQIQSQYPMWTSRTSMKKMES